MSLRKKYPDLYREYRLALQEAERREQGDKDQQTELVFNMIQSGGSWDDVARIYKITRQAAHGRFTARIAELQKRNQGELSKRQQRKDEKDRLYRESFAVSTGLGVFSSDTPRGEGRWVMDEATDSEGFVVESIG